MGPAVMRKLAIPEEPTRRLPPAAPDADFPTILGLMLDEELELPAALAAIAEAVRAKPRWEVLPDAMVLGFFSFAKFLMYRDLDPETWPASAAIDVTTPAWSACRSAYSA